MNEVILTIGGRDECRVSGSLIPRGFQVPGQDTRHGSGLAHAECQIRALTRFFWVRPCFTFSTTTKP